MNDPTLLSVDRDGALAEALDGLGEHPVTRADLLRRSVVGGGLGLATASIFAGLTSPASAQTDTGPLPVPLSRQQRRFDLAVLRFTLVVEQLGAAFYQEAVDRGQLRGETKDYARIARRDERAHVVAVAGAIGSLGARPGPFARFDFGDVTSFQDRFQRTAQQLEQMCVAALNGAGPLVSSQVLAAAAQLVSVEARQVAWITRILGGVPADTAFDPAITLGQARAAVRATGFLETRLPSPPTVTSTAGSA
jgi:hypothetical protein